LEKLLVGKVVENKKEEPPILEVPLFDKKQYKRLETITYSEARRIIRKTQQTV